MTKFLIAAALTTMPAAAFAYDKTPTPPPTSSSGGSTGGTTSPTPVPAPAYAAIDSGHSGVVRPRTGPELSDLALFVFAAVAVWLVRRALRRRFRGRP